MESVTLKYFLVGPAKGHSLWIREHEFVEGVHTFTGRADWADSLGRYFEANGWALRQGHPELKEKLLVKELMDHTAHGTEVRDDASYEHTSPQGAVVGEHDGVAPAWHEGLETPTDDREEPPVNERLKDAILKLDPKVNAHWSKNGEPSVVAVARLYGSNVTRKEIDATLPDFKRPAK
jgi:hypothetical protein